MVSDTLLGRYYALRVISLNPCSNGIWSLTKEAEAQSLIQQAVLILVLMEYGL